MSETIAIIEQDQSAGVNVFSENQEITDTHKQFSTSGQPGPGSLIDTFIEWENNPEDDDFWA